MTIDRPVIYFDMDGVLTEYDRSLYETKDGSIPLFLRHKSHVFKHLKPNVSMVNLYNELRNSQHDIHVKILTSIPVGLLQFEHTYDKFIWCKYHLQPFSDDDFFCVSVPKHQAVADSLWPLRRHHLLLDDWNENLYNWQDHGGTAVKCLNGINSYNERFPTLDITWSIPDMMERLTALAFGEE